MSKIKTSEVISVIVATASIAFLSISLVNDFKPVIGKFEYKQLKRKEEVIGNLLSKDALNDPITTSDLKTHDVIATLPYLFPKEEIEKIQDKPKIKADQIIRSKLNEEKLKNLTRRVMLLEDKSDQGIWTVLKALGIWILSTFFAPVIAHLGKSAFGIDEKSS